MKHCMQVVLLLEARCVIDLVSDINARYLLGGYDICEFEGRRHQG